jgi:hypothetical protein
LSWFAAIAAGIAFGSFGTAAGRAPLLPRSAGISGYSGEFGVDCNSCHSGGTAPTVTLDGPAYVLHDSTRAYSFVVSGGQQVAAGLDVSVDDGSLVASEAGTHLDAGEVTHDAPRLVDGNGDARFTFDFVAPSSASTVTMYASGNSVDHNGLNFGDLAASTTLTITVVDSLTSFLEFGQPLAGSGGIAPHLVGVEGPSAGPWSIAIEDGLGAGAGLLWVGLATIDLSPVFGGHFYVDLAVPPWAALPVQLDGTAGAAGGGSITFTGVDLSAFAPLTMYLQGTLLDAAAIRGISMTNALQLDVLN